MAFSLKSWSVSKEKRESDIQMGNFSLYHAQLQAELDSVKVVGSAEVGPEAYRILCVLLQDLNFIQ
jgi:hypothetical protein